MSLVSHLCLLTVEFLLMSEGGFLGFTTSSLSDPLLVGVTVHQWGTDEVGAWLDVLCLTEYKDIFIGHDVRGAELIHLERRDLKVSLLLALMLTDLLWRTHTYISICVCIFIYAIFIHIFIDIYVYILFCIDIDID